VNKRDTKDLIKKARKLAKPFRVTDGSFRLKDIDPGDTREFTSEDKPRAKEALAMGVSLLADLQDMLYAQDRWAVLLIFQAMDAAGKDGAIKHVMSGVNPQGCQVFSFKAPSSADLDHDFLWRCMICLPERGRIGIFNRSYYEEILVVLQVETRTAVEEIDQIVRVPGVDVIFIGPGDLSTALGHMGNPGHPDVQAAFARVEKATRAAGLALGNITRGWDQVKELYGKGYQFLTLGSDTSLVVSGSQDLVARFHKDIRP